MYEGWLALGGQEIGNRERFAAYSAELGLPGVRPGVRVPALPAVLADTPYETGGAIDSPWYDPALPESAGFAGLWIKSITGLDASTSTRIITDLAGHGGIPAPARNSPRTMVVTAFLAATSDLALKYGVSWLDAVLHDDCEGGCSGATLCLLAAAPDCPAGTGAEADQCWRDLARTLHDVTCVAGPTVHETMPLGCREGAAGATVDFTLVASVPFIYRFPEVVADAIEFGAPVTSGCQIRWIPVGPGRGATCPPPPSCDPPGDCASDPLAPVPEIPTPGVPPLCWARPVSAWAAHTAPVGLLPRWLDSVPVITVSTGGSDMRRLAIRLHADPMLTGIASPEAIDPCTALAEINVSYLARDTTLVIDGRTQEAYVVCPGGGTEPADLLLSGSQGGAFQWPTVVCGARLSVLALVDAAFYHPEAAVTVELASRTDAA